MVYRRYTMPSSFCLHWRGFQWHCRAFSSPLPSPLLLKNGFWAALPLAWCHFGTVR